jgi:Ca2+-binding EF-hand superfamily protein
MMDRDKSGKVSKEEIKKIFEEANIQVSSWESIEKIVTECDKNKDG